MAAVVDAISVVSGLVTLVGFSQDLFGTGAELSGSTIKVAAALEGGPGGASNTGGDLPDVDLTKTKTKTTTTTTVTMRSAPNRPLWMSFELVVSNGPGNSARALCESPMSLGPDFAHVREGLFCDMDQKKLHPFCDSGGGPQNHTNIKTTTACFDLHSMALVLPTTHRLRGRALRPRASPYARLRDWRQSRLIDGPTSRSLAVEGAGSGFEGRENGERV